MWYWLVDSLFLFQHLLFPLSLLSGRFGVHKVNLSGDGSASDIQMVCVSIGVNQFYWCMTSCSYLSSRPVPYFFPWYLFSSAVVADIPATERFYLFFFRTGLVGIRKANDASKPLLRPVDTSSILIEESAAQTPDSSQSTLSRIYLTLCLVSFNLCWKLSVHCWGMVYDALWWFKNNCTENPVFPVHFMFTSKFIVSLISLSQWYGPTN